MKSEDNLLDFQLNETFNLLLPNEAPAVLGQLGWDGTYATLHDGTIVQQLAYLSDLGSGGITSLNGLTGSSQTFVNDTNVTIVSSGSTHTITWAGTLADGRIASASVWNSKQAGSTNLTSLSALSYVSGAFVKMTGANTFTLDTNTYLTSLTGAWLVGGQSVTALDKLGSTNNVPWDLVANNLTVLRVTPVASGSGINYLTVTNSASGNPVAIGAGGSADVSIRITPSGSGSFLTGNLSLNTNTISSSSQLLFTSSTATQFSVNNNNFTVGTGNNGAILFNSILASASNSLNSFTVSAGNGTGTGTHNAFRIAGALNNSSASGVYNGIIFDQTITAFTGTLSLIKSTLNANTNWSFINHTGTAISNFGGNVNLTGSAKITTYAGITTEGNGVATVIKVLAPVVGASANIATTNIITAPSTGIYHVCVLGDVTSGAGSISYVTITYTQGGVSKTQQDYNYFAFNTTSKIYVIKADSGTNISYSTTVVGTLTYNLDISVLKIS